MNCFVTWYRLSENWTYRKSVKLLIFLSRSKQFGKISQRFPHEFPYLQHTIDCIIITHNIRGKPNTKFKIKYLFGLQTEAKSNNSDTMRCPRDVALVRNFEILIDFIWKKWSKKSVGRVRPTCSNLLLKPIYCDWKACCIQLIVRYVT